MASDPSSPGQSTPQTPTEKPSTPPVNILSSPVSRVYSIIHPALLLALGAAHFETLVANPTKGLLNSLPWLTLSQILYVVICLPPAGSTETTAPADGKSSSRSPGPASRHGKHGKRKQHVNSWTCIWSRLLVRLPSITNPMPWILTLHLARFPRARFNIRAGYSSPGGSPRPLRCSSHNSQYRNYPWCCPFGCSIRYRAHLHAWPGPICLE